MVQAQSVSYYLLRLLVWEMWQPYAFLSYTFYISFLSFRYMNIAICSRKILFRQPTTTREWSLVRLVLEKIFRVGTLVLAGVLWEVGP